MPNLITLLMDASSAHHDAGVDWKTVIGIPAAFAAAIAVAAYFVGWIRPLAVVKPRYWYEGDTTQFVCWVRNRKMLYDQRVDSISLVEVPGRLKRFFWPFWRRTAQVAAFIPWGPEVEIVRTQHIDLTKRQRHRIRGEIRRPAGPGRLTLDPRLRIQAHAGAKRSRSRRIKPGSAS